jgi:hypothetical protein
MKIVNVLLIILLATGLSFSQSFQLQNVGVSGETDTLVVGPIGGLLIAKAQVKNISLSNKDSVRCKRIIISLDSPDQNYFCWGALCGSPMVDTATSIVSIASGAVNTTFYGDISELSSSGINDTVRYTVWDKTNPSDSISWVVVYEFSAGINQISSGPKNTLVKAFPDPSDNTATIQYSLAKDARSAQINVMNMLGNKVGEYSLDLRDSKFVIPTNSLAPGIYFYSLEVDGSIISTKKLVINR